MVSSENEARDCRGNNMKLLLSELFKLDFRAVSKKMSTLVVRAERLL